MVGLVTGASDDDPSGIATYSQAGSQIRSRNVLYGAIPITEVMIVVQEICARIGLVIGKGLVTVIKNRYSRNVVYPVSGLPIVANTINIGADIGAMAASIDLFFLNCQILPAIMIFTMTILVAEIFIPYVKYVQILKYLTLFFLRMLKHGVRLLPTVQSNTAPTTTNWDNYKANSTSISVRIKTTYVFSRNA